jgi:hypothetical protein
MEMLWINSQAIHADEFFHGPFEVVVPVLDLSGAQNGEKRLAHRRYAFLGRPMAAEHPFPELGVACRSRNRMMLSACLFCKLSAFEFASLYLGQDNERQLGALRALGIAKPGWIHDA